MYTELRQSPPWRAVLGLSAGVAVLMYCLGSASVYILSLQQQPAVMLSTTTTRSSAADAAAQPPQHLRTVSAAVSRSSLRAQHADDLRISGVKRYQPTLGVSNEYTQSKGGIADYPWDYIAEPYKITTLQLLDHNGDIITADTTEMEYHWTVDDHLQGIGVSVQVVSAVRFVHCFL